MKYSFLVIAIISIVGCSPKQSDNNNIDITNLITGEGFDEYMQVLSSDSLLGRKPFTDGETRTINYLTNTYETLGLQPGNGDSYLQKVAMVEVLSTPGTLSFAGQKETIQLNHLTDYVAGSRRLQPQLELASSPVVFAGYGIVAPEFGWNDYEGLDVKGKTVIVLVNDPGFFDSTLFKGKTMTYYGRWTYKFEEAARQGAAGVLIVHDTKPASYDWPVVRNGWSKSRLLLKTPNNNADRAIVEGWLTMPTVEKLFELAGQPIDLLKQAGQKGFKSVPLNVKASVKINNSWTESSSHNVAALLPGSEQKDEYIIYTAHWDHFGIGEPIIGDSIYNGAADNASGTAALIEIAKAFTQLPEKPKRSILFLSVTAEEQGLLGSEFYTQNPIYPIAQTVANINVDVMQPFGKMKDVIVVGKGQSEMDEWIDKAAAKQNRYTRGEPDPSGGWFFRSDHFNFAKVGIPALYIENGTVSVEHGEEWGQKQKEDYNTNRYHQPSDEYINWDNSGIIADIKLLFDVGYTLSNDTVFPKWKDGSEFKAVREKQQK